MITLLPIQAFVWVIITIGRLLITVDHVYVSYSHINAFNKCSRLIVPPYRFFPFLLSDEKNQSGDENSSRYL